MTITEYKAAQLEKINNEAIITHLDSLPDGSKYAFRAAIAKRVNTSSPTVYRTIQKIKFGQPLTGDTEIDIAVCLQHLTDKGIVNPQLINPSKKVKCSA